MQMKERLKRLAEIIDALSPRERALLLGAVLAVLFSVWDQLLMAPLVRQHAVVSNEMEAVRDNLSKLDRQIEAIIRSQRQDPDQANRDRLVQLNAVHERLDGRIAEVTVDLIPPRKMARVLEEILVRKKNLELVRVESLGAKPLLEPDDNRPVGESDPPAEIPGIFRHGLVIEFEGGYFATLEYLQALEGLPWRFFWESIDYQVEEFPRARVTVTVSTLSFNQGWIGV